jgi:uncharacterized membrane protein YhaH (DUF805 family)
MQSGAQMSDGWYYADGDKSVGPMSLDDVGRALGGRANPATVMVWRDGFAAWKPAGEVPELAPYAGAAPSAPGMSGLRGAGVAGAAQPENAGTGSLLNVWFGFSGRLNRAKYWLVVVVNLVVLIVLGVAGYVADTSLIWGILVLAVLVLAVSGLAIGVKRLHDREKSAWWLLLFYLGPSVLSAVGGLFGDAGAILFGLASLALSIWTLVELGCLRGTDGPNRYGPDPLRQG